MSIMTVWAQESRASQARTGHGIEDAVIGLCIEQRTRGVKSAGPGREAGNEKPWIGSPVHVAAGAADMRFASGFAKSVWRVEREIAQVGHVRFVAARRLGMKNLARIVRCVFVEFAADGQAAAAIGDGRGVGATAASEAD